MTRNHWIFLGYFAFVGAAFASFGPSGMLKDSDTFWHIVVGDQILQSGEFPQRDEFTFTRYGERWIPSQWLAECAMALVVRLGGFSGLVFVTSLMLVAVYAWAGDRLRRSGLHGLLALFLTALVLATSSYHFLARPHVVTILFSALLVHRLAEVERRERPVKGLWPLIPLFLLWTNLHGGVLGGIGTLGLVVGWWSLAGRRRGSGPFQSASDGREAGEGRTPFTRRDVLWAWGTLLACGLTILANPYGTGIPEMWLRVMSANLPDIIIEHAPLNVRRPYGLLIVVLFAGYAAALVGTMRVPRATWLLPLVWFGLTVTRIRHGPIFSIVTLMVLPEVLAASRVGDWLRRRGWFRDPPALTAVAGFARIQPAAQRHTVRLNSCEFSYEKPGFWRGVGFGGLLVLVLAVCYLAVWPAAYGRWRARPDPRIWPAELLPELESLEARLGEGARIFNEQRLAGFVIYNTPGFRVFVDGRCELFGESFLREYVAAQDDPQIIRGWETKYAFRVALVNSGSAYDRYFRALPEWSAVRRTPAATLYVRKSIMNSPVSGTQTPLVEDGQKPQGPAQGPDPLIAMPGF